MTASNQLSYQGNYTQKGNAEMFLTRQTFNDIGCCVKKVFPKFVAWYENFSSV